MMESYFTGSGVGPMGKLRLTKAELQIPGSRYSSNTTADWLALYSRWVSGQLTSWRLRACGCSMAASCHVHHALHGFR